MKEYECQLLLASKVYSDYNKVIRPLCSTCTNESCMNPIVDCKVSVYGKIVSSRLYKTANSEFFVVSCEGYRGEEVETDEECD